MQLDTSYDFVSEQLQTVVGGDPVYVAPVSPFSAAAVEPAPTMVDKDTASDADRVRIVRECFEDDGILSSTEGMIGIVEMRAYVNGRCAR